MTTHQAPKLDNQDPVSLFLASVVLSDNQAALIVAQEAASEKELASCSADGPQEGTYLCLPARATAISVLSKLSCFKAHEAQRLHRDRRSAALNASTFFRRFRPEEPGAGSRRRPANASGLSQEEEMRLSSLNQALQASQRKRQQHFFRDADNRLCMVPLHGVAVGIGLVRCDDAGEASHFQAYAKFRAACGSPVTCGGLLGLRGQ